MDSDLSSVFRPSRNVSNSLPFNWVVQTLTKIKAKEGEGGGGGDTMTANTNFSLSSIFPPSNSSIAWNWVIETLTDIKPVDAAALEGVMIAHCPDFMSNSRGSLKERIALKCLEEWFDAQLPSPPLPTRIPHSLLEEGCARRIDPNKSADEVMLLLIDKAINSNDQVKDGSELFKHVLHQFILKKRANLPKHSIDLLKDSITEGSGSNSFSKDKVLMPRVDQIAPSNEECEKAEKWKLNIQNYGVLLQKHVSASMANYNSNKILAGGSSGSRQYTPDPKSKELELPNQISTNPAAENGMGILHEDPYGYGQKSPQPPQRDDRELELLNQVSDSLAAESGKEIRQEDPSGFGEQSNQRNDKEHVLKQISAAPAGNICKELLQTHCSGFEPHSPNRNDTFRLLQKFSSAQANGSDKEIMQENPCGFGLQSLSQQQNGEFQSPEQIPSMLGAVSGKEILHEYPYGSGQQSDQQNASRGGFRKLPRRITSNTVCNSPNVLEPSVMPLPPSNKDREDNANGSSVIVDPLLWRSTVTDGELNIPKAPSDVDGCHDPPFIFDQKSEMLPDEKHRRSAISFNQNFMNNVGIESALCLKCDKRGSLLVCSGSGCPVSVHDRCIGSLVVFDEKGHFFCPSCSYAQASLAYYKAKKKYSQAKKALASFMGKDSVRRHEERPSHPAVPRNTSPMKQVGNMDCHGKGRKCQENVKTSRHHKQKVSTIHHNIEILPGRAEASQSVKKIEVSCDAGELEDSEKPVDDHEGIMQRQTHATVVLDNEKVPCSSVYLNVEVAPLTELENGIVDGRLSTDMMKHQKTLTDKGMREGCPNVQDIIVKSKATPGDSNLTYKETATSRIKEIHHVHPQANVNCETASVKTGLEAQVKDVTEQNMGNLHYRKTSSPVTTAKHAKRKLNLQINNEIVDSCQRTGTVKRQLTEATAATNTANLTWGQGETSEIREAHPSQVNMKSKITPDKFSEIQNLEHQEQATHAEQDTHNSPYQVVVAPLTSEGNVRKKRLHFAISQDQHPHLTCKRQIGWPSVLNVSEGQNESNYGSNSSRSRHFWRPEEEKVLKDAMQKVSLENGNIPWVKIWEKIKHVFCEARQPSDLKDKWRNIMMKEAREQEKGRRWLLRSRTVGFSSG